MPNSVAWLRGSVKEWSLVLLALVAILGSAMLYAYPLYYEFDAPGEMIAVEAIGIDGDVHFVTVYSGITENLIQRYVMEWSMEEETRFYKVDPYYARYASDWEELSYYREETITHAFEAVIGEETEPEQGRHEGGLGSHLEEVLANTVNFYGDSMGLMVAIGLYEEQHHLDYSVGGQYVIAGTGTLEADRSVGTIAALEQKLILAEREGVTHFFVPKDWQWYEEEGNEAEARRVARARDLEMEIIPVAVLEEALDYLDVLLGKTLPGEEHAMRYPSRSLGKFHFLLLLVNLLVSLGLLVTHLSYSFAPDIFYMYLTQWDFSLLALYPHFAALAHVSFLVWMIFVHMAVQRLSPDYPVGPGGFLVRMLPVVNVWGIGSAFSRLWRFFHYVSSVYGATNRLRVYTSLIYAGCVLAVISYLILSGEQNAGIVALLIGIGCSIVMFVIFLAVTYDVNRYMHMAAQVLPQHVVAPLTPSLPGGSLRDERQAERWKRAIASFIDSALFILLVLAAVMAVVMLDPEESGLYLGLFGGLAIVGYVVYYAVHVSLSGQTLGKWMTGIRIVKADTGEPGGFLHNFFLRSFVNYMIASFVPFYSLVDICFIFSSDARCLHDRIAGTMVVDVKRMAAWRGMIADEGTRSV